MIQCPYCGASVDDRSPFCPLCFTSLQPDQRSRRSGRSAAQQSFPQQAPQPSQQPGWYNAGSAGYIPSAPNQPLPPQGYPAPLSRQAYPHTYAPGPQNLSYYTGGYAPADQGTASPQQGFERSRHARSDLAQTDPEYAREQSRKEIPLPRWLIVSSVTALIVCLVLVASIMMIRADLRIRYDERVLAYQTLVAKHPRPGSVQPLVEKYAAQYNLQPAYVDAIILNESNFQENAQSRLGARGLMQVMENTGKWIAERIGMSGYTFESMYTAETNIRFGCWYLNYLSKLFDGDPVLVTAAYHAGQGNVKIWLRNPDYSDDGVHIDVSRIPTSDTKTYVSRVMKDYAIYDALYDRTFNSGDTAVLDPAAVRDAGGAGE